jgi:hypothetical protein
MIRTLCTRGQKLIPPDCLIEPEIRIQINWTKVPMDRLVSIGAIMISSIASQEPMRPWRIAADNSGE